MAHKVTVKEESSSCPSVGCCGQQSCRKGDGAPRIKEEVGHQNSTTSDGSLVCDDCGKVFVHQKSYTAHLLSHSGAFSCKVCSKNFSNIANLNIHSRIHSGHTPFKCTKCSMCFRTSSMLKRHVIKEHSNKEAGPVLVYDCPNCNRKLGSLKSFQKHVERHDVQNLHVCELCHVDCFTHNAYLSHKKRCHSGEKGKTVLEKIQQNTCHICKSSFYTISALWNHATLYHAPFLGLPCNVCGKLAITRNAYMTHRRTHIEAKDYVCHVCGKRFNKASHLQDHVRVHFQDYTYKCPVCGKGFLRPKNLQTHLLAKHRPTVDTCCLRTLQRRKKKLGVVDNGAGSIFSRSSDFGSSEVSSNCTSFGGRVQSMGEIDGLKLKQEIKTEPVEEQYPSANQMYDDYEVDSNIRDEMHSSTDRSSSNTSGYSDSESSTFVSQEHKKDRASLDATFLQVSAFPKFDWKRVPTMYTEEPSRSPYIDYRGHPLFSKNKPAARTKQLVAMAKSTHSQKKTTSTVTSSISSAASQKMEN